MTVTALASPDPEQPTTRVRLLRVMVQPVFVLDDGTALTERPGQPVEVPASQWRDFAVRSFDAAEMAELQAQYEASLAESKEQA